VPEAVNLAAAEQARKRGIRVILNAAPFRPLSKPFVQLVDVLVVNAVEAEMMGTGHVCCLASASAAAHLLARDFDCVIVTAGSQGLAVWTHDDTPVQIPAENVTVVSSHGAGDAFIGALAAALLQGQCIEAACRLASSAAARHVAGLA
jgi:ribokinase